MKTRFIIFALTVMAGLSLVMSGCLKDDAFENGEIQSAYPHGDVSKVVEMALTAGNSSNFLALALNNSSKDTTLNLVPINLATAAAAPQDLHVTVALDPALVETYNTDNETDYQIPPASIYTIVSSEVVIPKGAHTGYVQIKFKVSDFLGGPWALGFKITAIKEPGYVISGNLNTGIANILIKNEWDGKYKIDGVIGGNNSYSGTKLSGTLPLTTVSSNAVAEGSIANFFGGYTVYTFNDDGTVGVDVLDAPGGSSLGAAVLSSSYELQTHNFKIKYTILSGKYVFDLAYNRTK